MRNANIWWAYLYQEGLGVPLNATEAIRLFRLSAKRG